MKNKPMHVGDDLAPAVQNSVFIRYSVPGMALLRKQMKMFCRIVRPVVIGLETFGELCFNASVKMDGL